MLHSDLRPVQHLRDASRLYPDAWRMVDRFRSMRGAELPRWPDYIVLPMSGWYAIVSQRFGGDRIPLDAIGDVARLAAIGAWRYTQGIYRFDADLLGAIADTDLAGDLPSEVLLRLPEWSVYVQAPLWCLGTEIYGFFAHLERDDDGRIELRLLVDMESTLFPMILHLGDWPVEEAVRKMLAESARQAESMGHDSPRQDEEIVARYAVEVRQMVALVLYLCADEPEITGEERERPSRAHETKTKSGQRLFPAAKPHIWRVGEEMGRTLREANRSSHERDSVRPHIRRAHWHGYWLGKRGSEDRRFAYRWLPPMLVSGREAEEK